MPDHLHALISFPPSGKSSRSIVSKWKEWTAKDLGIDWQRDFFEHRLRHDESRREKADYILSNPVRKQLVSRAEEWLFVYFADSPHKHHRSAMTADDSPIPPRSPRRGDPHPR
jgi:putative transposase